MLSAPLDDNLISFAHCLADAAGQVVRSYFRKPVAVDDKADASPVTIADREAETAMRALIESAYPDHGIFGEEHGAKHVSARYVWVLDPIDGTRAFITGKPSFGTLIALLEDGRPVLGIIDQAITGERWVGARGRVSVLNGEPIKTRACGALDQSILYATAPDMFAGADRTAFDRLSAKVKLTRFGADCYAYGLLALGFVDLVVESSLKPYDYCALIPVIEGAGGLLTDWQGAPLGLASDGRVIAAGDKALHDQARALLLSS